MSEKINLDIDIKTLLKITIFIVLLWLIFQIKEVILLFFIVLIIVAALSPIISRWSNKIPRIAAISLIYLIILVITVGIFSILIPPLVTQIQQIARDLPYYINSANSFQYNQSLIDIGQQGLSQIAKNINTISSQIFSTTLSFFQAIVSLFTIIVLSFYLLIEENSARKLIASYIPIQNREKVLDTIHKIGLKIGAWLRGQLMLGVIIGLIDGIGLAIIGVPYALTLGLFAGLTELVPYVGPIIGAIPALLIALFADPIKAILTLVLYIIVQQVESQFLVPKIMQKAVGLSPVIIIMSLIIGAKLDGMLGVMLAIPVAAAISVVIQEYSRSAKVNS